MVGQFKSVGRRLDTCSKTKNTAQSYSIAMTTSTYPAPPVIVAPTSRDWKLVKTTTSDWPIEYIQNLQINASTLKDAIAKSEEAGSRFLRDIIPQIKRALTRQSTGEAILVLTMCPLRNESTGSLDDPSCRTERLIAALERPRGPSVVHFNLRTDCIRLQQLKKNGEVDREDCLTIKASEHTRCLEFLTKEITMARSFGIKFVSVFSFSSA
jgi:hypothetical protein